MTIKNAKIFRPDCAFHQEDICVNGELISDTPSDNDVWDAEGLYLIPGLIDIHIHGCAGYDFCEGTHESTGAMASYQLQNGITAFTPATMTLAIPELMRICKNAATYSGGGAELAGIYLEGPFFNPDKKGAQDAAYMCAPDYPALEQLQEASGGCIKTVCVAPELPGAMSFIGAASQKYSVSIAHTAADYEIAAEAFCQGAVHVTHLYNAMNPFLHRAPGVVGAVADHGSVTAELICDGYHIHPSVIRSTVRMLGHDRIIFVSDSMMATGMPDGTYSLGEQTVTVQDGRALLQDGSIASSTTNLMECLRRAVSFGIPLEQAVQMTTINPARRIRLDNKMGSLEAGKLANFVLLDKDLALCAVFLRGRKV